MSKPTQKIVIMTAEEVAECRQKARSRSIFKEMMGNGQYRAKKYENKKRKAQKNIRRKEDRAMKNSR